MSGVTLYEMADMLDTINERLDVLIAQRDAYREALEITANQLEGVSLAIRDHGTNINVSFFIETYADFALKAREVLDRFKEKKE